MTRRGFTLIEILIVVVIMGVMTAIGYPKIRDQLMRSDVRSAAARVAAVYAQGRANAIQTGRATTLNYAGNRLWLTQTVAGVLDTVGTVQHIDLVYNATITATDAGITIDPRGIIKLAGDAHFVVTRGDYADTVTIGRYGSIVKR